jgi:hypothetical protein
MILNRKETRKMNNIADYERVTELPEDKYAAGSATKSHGSPIDGLNKIAS